MASSSIERNFPRIKTIQSWKSDFLWLIIENSSGMNVHNVLSGKIN